MLNGKRYWIYNNKDEEKLEFFAESLNITKTTAQVLLNRGIEDLNKAKAFLYPNINELYDPFLLKDMDRAVQRIQDAIQNSESIWIYGDYDVDGVASTTIMIKYFQSINYPVHYYIPNRIEEGYGINKEAIKEIADKGGNLIITVDCGITSIDEVKYCHELGVDIIITDHHECHEGIPEAIAVINPKRKDCQYPFGMLCGCGVAFKLIQALTPTEVFQKSIDEYLDIVAIATVADIVPLIDENRIFVKHGLEYMPKSQNIGVQALLEVCGLKGKKLNAGHIGFILAPRVNAAGRIGTANTAVKLFTSTDYQEAKQLALHLDEENRNRQEIEIKIFNEAVERIEKDKRYEKDKVFVLYDKEWHHGVIGIVASRIVEKYYKPTIILAVEEEEAKGSARSIPGFNIFEAMNQCKDIFEKFGGHEQAAGLSLKVEHIEALQQEMNRIANEMLTEEDFIPKIYCDGIVKMQDINSRLIEELETLEPYGMGNSSPRFIYRYVYPVEVKAVGIEGRHLKMQIENHGIRMDAIGFQLGKYADFILPGNKIRIVFTPEYNEFNGTKKIQLNIKDIKVIDTNGALNQSVVQKYYQTLMIYEEAKEPQQKEFELPPVLAEEDKEEVLLKELKDQKGPILVLVNTLEQALRLLNFTEIREKDRDYEYQSFFTEPIFPSKENEFHIVMNPNIDKIQFKSYNKIILYDMFFSEKKMIRFLESIQYEKTRILYQIGDETSNEKVFQETFPTRDILAKLYRRLRERTRDNNCFSFKEINEYMLQQYQFRVNEVLLKNAFDIFKEGNLLKYYRIGNDYIIQLATPSKKIDLEKLKTYQSLKNSYKRFLYFKNKLLELYIRRK